MDNDFLISQSKTATLPTRDYTQKGNSPVMEHNRGTGISEPMSEPELALAVHRFNTKISSGKPFRDDVSRGYYLNVRV